MLKIMHVLPSLEVAGAEIMTENLITSISKAGYDVSVVSLYSYRSPITERLEKRGIRVYYLDKKPGLDLSMIKKLQKLFLLSRPTILHTHLHVLKYTIPGAIMARIPVRVHTVHNIAEREVGSFESKIHGLAFAHLRVQPVAISPRVQDSIASKYRIPKTSIPIILNGIDLRHCTPKYEYDVSDGIVKILHIGRFSEQKNHAGLIYSFKLVHKEVPNSRLILIGTGELEPSIRHLVDELELSDCVQFVGQVSNVYPYLSTADIFVLPSLWEGMPITLLEAMATGLPIVASCVGGVPDIITNGVTGLLVEIDENQISSAIVRLARERELRSALGTAAREKSKDFSAESMSSKYLNLYRKLLGDEGQILADL